MKRTGFVKAAAALLMDNYGNTTRAAHDFADGMMEAFSEDEEKEVAKMRLVEIQTIQETPDRPGYRILGEKTYAAKTIGEALDKHAPDPAANAVFKIILKPSVEVVE